ncbi:MAG TPA: hypothetical protein PK523_01070 [Elusimicrobiales bacterium]|nr:hypothetical protein [Elusimicrobiales bacterium]
MKTGKFHFLHVDRLLDKISSSGMESLSRREREALERLSRERGGRA